MMKEKGIRVSDYGSHNSHPCVVYRIYGRVCSIVTTFYDSNLNGSWCKSFLTLLRARGAERSENMQLAPMAPSCASSHSKQIFQRKREKILGELYKEDHKEEKKLLKFMAPPLMAAVIALSPLSNPPASLGQSTVNAHRGATLFRRACIGCHDAGGNIIQPGATLFLNDLQRNGVDTEEEIYRVTYYGKGRMPGFGENCTPRGQCTFGPRLGEDEIKLLAEFVKSQAEQGWPKIETGGD